MTLVTEERAPSTSTSTLSSTDPFQRVVAVIRPYIQNVDALPEITPATTILDELHVNSARFVDIVLALEDEFDVSIDDADADDIETVGDAVALIAKLRAA